MSRKSKPVCLNELSLHAFIIFARFCHWSSINCWKWVIKEVLLSVSGTCTFLVCFLWVRGNRVLHKQKGKLLLGTFQGNLTCVMFWSWCLLQKIRVIFHQLLLCVSLPLHLLAFSLMALPKFSVYFNKNST